MKCARVCQLTQILVVVIAGCSASFAPTEKTIYAFPMTPHMQFVSA
jgi:hypothetical protein